MDGIYREMLTAASADPNPDGAADCQLYLLQGNAAPESVDKIMTAPGTTLPPAPAFLHEQSFSLRVVHFNDFHGHLVRFGRDGDHSIVSRVAGHISSSRNCQDDVRCAVLALSSGDDCGGSIFDELLDSQGEKVSHLYYRLYSKLGVDAACPGNHDFDRGLAFLEASVQAEARFPMLAANVISTGQYTRGIYPAAILVVKGVRVGVIGLVTRAENRLAAEEGRIVDPRPVAARLVEMIRPLSDVLIILSHLGRSLHDKAVPMLDCGDVELAESLPAGCVDLIVGAHSHHALNLHGLEQENIVNGIPILQAGADGRFLGQVDLEVHSDAVRLKSVQLIPVDTLPIDRGFEEQQLKPWKQAARELLSRDMGVVQIAGEQGDSVQVDFSSGEMALANFFTDSLAERLASHAEPVDFAMLDASALHSGLMQGESLTFSDCFELMPYYDTIRIYRLTGAELHALLVDNALRLRHPDEEGYIERGFLQFSAAIRCRIQRESHGQAKLLEASAYGIPLTSQYERVFSAAATCFTRELCSVWESEAGPELQAKLFSLHKLPHRETNWILRDEITAFIREHGGITAASGARKDGRLVIVQSE